MARAFVATCLLFAAFAPPLHAENLYRCVGSNGTVSYQSQVCPAGQRLDRVLEYRADPIRPSDAGRPSQARREGRRPSARSGHPRTARGDAAATANARCRASKAKREAALQRLGLSRTYDQLSRLDAPVRDACRGF